MIYQFRCQDCYMIFDVEKSMKCSDLLTTLCPYCKHISVRIWTPFLTIDNFMPHITGSLNHSKSKMKEFMQTGVWTQEPPTRQFWKDVEAGKIVKKGNLYVRKN